LNDEVKYSIAAGNQRFDGSDPEARGAGEIPPFLIFPNIFFVLASRYFRSFFVFNQNLLAVG
jgi:hypothetical protein